MLRTCLVPQHLVSVCLYVSVLLRSFVEVGWFLHNYAPSTAYRWYEEYMHVQ